MKSLKFTANELLDSFNREFNRDEVVEVYKAIAAYNLDYKELTNEQDKELEEVIDNIIDDTGRIYNSFVSFLKRFSGLFKKY